jgi:hypothetical protein
VGYEPFLADTSIELKPVPPKTSDPSALAPVPDSSRVRSGLREALRHAQNADGGWAYSAGKRSRLEPTCWASVALAAADGRPVEIERLKSWPRHDGWLVDVPGAPPNQAFNALAALTLLQDPSTELSARPVISNLLSAKGGRYRQSEYSPEDNSLQGWSWVAGTASWVEPTAWSLLLLKTLRRNGSLPREGAERIEIGERLLLDRVCSVGGWNYGNRRVHGHDLWPYVPTTALALLALQDRRDLSSVKRSVEQMQRDLTTERSSVAFALAHICLKVYGRHPRTGGGTADRMTGSQSRSDNTEIGHELTRLALSELETTGVNVLGQAMTLYALSDTSRAPAIFSF